MKKDEVKIGHLYVAKVSDRIVTVRIDSTNSHGGWNATNTATGKRIRIKSAQRLRRAVPADRQAATQADAAPEPEVNPTVEVVAGQPLPDSDGEKAAKPPARPKPERKPAGDSKPKRLSALDAAAEVLAKAGKPMRAQELVAAMAEQGLWSSPAGKTPHATLYAAMMREARDKGDAARFRKVDRGQFAYNAKEA
jgi:hypothetical protein